MGTPHETATQLAAITNQLNTAYHTHTTTTNDAYITYTNTLTTALNTLTATITPLLTQQQQLLNTLTTPPHTPRFPGDTPPGTLRWGQGGGNDTARAAEHETAAGVPLGAWRLFYTTQQLDMALRRCRDAVAARRVPILSLKPHVPWVDVAAGRLDTTLSLFFNDLKNVPGPVWLIVHHEPEGGGSAGNKPDDPGGAAAWRGMQVQVRRLLDRAAVRNVAFGPCLMVWTWAPQSGRRPDDWWVDDARWDFYGADLYQSSEAGPAPTTQASWLNFVAWAQRRNLPVVLGELGNRGSDATAAAELRETYEFLCGIDCVGATYFDTHLNSGPAPYTLTGAPLAEFRRLMTDPRSVTLPG